MESEIITRNTLLVVGMKYHGRNEPNQIPGLWDVFMPRAYEVQAKVNEHVAYGVMGNYDQASGEFDYVAGFEVNDADHIPEGMVTWEIPAQTYAVFPTTMPTLTETYDQLYESWLPQSGYKHAGGPEFEYYGETFDPSDPTSEMQIYIPIVT
jgi:AraC family transcriptional regulator